MPSKRDQLRALARICTAFGGRLAIVSQEEFDDLFDRPTERATRRPEDLSVAPFTDAHGQWWRKKIVYAIEGREEVGTIIHEMGHVFASEHHPDHDCNSCHEWNWFGWEIALARHIGAARTWSRHNANYRIDDASHQWSNVTPAQRRSVTLDRLAHARKRGVLDQDGLPRSLR
jgi:hypothetical protein